MCKLVLDSIFYSFSDQEILNGCYLTAEKGKVTGLFGRNGSGKSTLLKIAAGQIQSDSGITVFEDKRLHKKYKTFRYSRLAYLPQDTFLLKNLRVMKLLDRLDIDRNDEALKGIENKKIKNLSTGIRRYLEINFVLSLNKDFVILDEPFSGLSPLLIEKVIAKINDQKSRVGFIIADHYTHYFFDVVDELYLMSLGNTKKIRNLKKFKEGLIGDRPK